MNPDRAIGLILTLSVAAVLALGTSSTARPISQDTPPPPTEAPSTTPTATVTATPTGALPKAAAGYRLAGTVVGAMSYAVIEAPAGGGSQLLRTGQILKGVGQLTSIEADRITIVGDNGPFVLRVAAAPTATAAPAATPTTVAPLPTRVPSEYESSP